MNFGVQEMLLPKIIVMYFCSLTVNEKVRGYFLVFKKKCFRNSSYQGSGKNNNVLNE